MNYNVVISGTCSPDVISANVSLSINENTIITLEPANQVSCEGDAVSLLVIADGTSLTYKWRNGTTDLINGLNISGVNSDMLTIDPVGLLDASLNYNVVVYGTCAANDTSINVSITVNANPVAVASSNSPVCVNSTINLFSETVLGGTYTWTGVNGYTSIEQNPVINSASTSDMGEYSLRVKLGACISAPSVITVIVNKCLETDFNIPEGFSPNGDLINDLFVVRGIDRFPNSKIVIFNRWGDKVFEASPYTNDWDGKATIGLILGEDELPIGTYFYILDLGSISEPVLGSTSNVFKGTIYLNR